MVAAIVAAVVTTIALLAAVDQLSGGGVRKQVRKAITAMLQSRAIRKSIATLPFRSRVTDWRKYPGILKFSGYRNYDDGLVFEVAFLHVWNPKKKGVLGLRGDDISIRTERSSYSLPSAYLPRPPLPSNVIDNPCCRVSRYRKVRRTQLEVLLSKTSYGDYWVSGEHLDDLIPGTSTTYRAEFGQIVGLPGRTLRPFPLTNICGNGIFLRSVDDFVLAVRHSDDSQVYPGRWTFSASGVMKWSDNPHPMTATIVKTHEELKRDVNPTNLRLTSFGVDARKLFFQFCWEEQLSTGFDKIDVPRQVECDALSLEPGDVVNAVLTRLWEPSAEAALLGLAFERHGEYDVLSALEERRSEWQLRSMRDEWDFRASQPGDLADMSLRYPRDQLRSASQAYVDWAFGHIQQLVADRDVLEIGPGTGRLTQRLVEVASRLTCVDLSQRMIARNMVRLGSVHESIDYRCQPGHTYQGRHDLVVALLVLTHHPDGLFDKLLDAMCSSSDTVVTCDDVSSRGSGAHTYLRTAEQIQMAFVRRGFALRKSYEYMLFNDKLALQIFRRNTPG